MVGVMRSGLGAAPYQVPVQKRTLIDWIALMDAKDAQSGVESLQRALKKLGQEVEELSAKTLEQQERISDLEKKVKREQQDALQFESRLNNTEKELQRLAYNNSSNDIWNK